MATKVPERPCKNEGIGRDGRPSKSRLIRAQLNRSWIHGVRESTGNQCAQWHRPVSCLYVRNNTGLMANNFMATTSAPMFASDDYRCVAEWGQIIGRWKTLNIQGFC